MEKDREYTSRKEGNAKRKNSRGISIEYFPIRRNGRFETLAEANLSNNFLFVKVMSDKVILKKFLEMVLKIKIRELKMIQYEKAVIPDITKTQMSPASKGGGFHFRISTEKLHSG